MKLQSIHSLFPDVRLLANERLVFAVKSRSGSGEWKVDKEKRMGMGECNCPNATKGRNHWCYHLQRVDRMMACALAQERMEAELSK